MENLFLQNYRTILSYKLDKIYIDKLPSTYEQLEKVIILSFEENWKYDNLPDNAFKEALAYFCAGMNIDEIEKEYGNLTKRKILSFVTKNQFTPNREKIPKILRHQIRRSKPYFEQEKILNKINKDKLIQDFNNLPRSEFLALYSELPIEGLKKIVSKEFIDTEEIIKDKIQVQWIQNNQLSKNDIYDLLVKETNDPFLRKKTVYRILEEKGYSRSKSEVNKIRETKSKGSANKDYQIKANTLKAIKESKFQTIESIVEYLNKSNETIATFAKKNLKLPYSIRSLEKMIMGTGLLNKKQSRVETEFYEALKEIFPSVKKHNRGILKGLEIDFIIPELNIGIEFNGDYWHSNKFVQFNKGMTSYEFHKKKKDLAELEGYQLLYVWESDWLNYSDKILTLLTNRDFDNSIFSIMSKDPTIVQFPSDVILKFLNGNNISYKMNNNEIEIVDLKYIIRFGESEGNIERLNELSDFQVLTLFPWHSTDKILSFLEYKLKLKHIKSIYARKCDVVVSNKLSKKDNQFIENNHILGRVPHYNLIAVVKLCYDNKIVGIGTFVKSKTGVELKRLVFLNGYSVVGGASKILKTFLKNYNETIYTYSDRNLSEGEVYSELGFTKKKSNAGSIMYYHPITKQSFSRVSLYRIGANRLLEKHPHYEPVPIGDVRTNEEIVLENGFKKIIDCGSYYWIKEKASFE